MKNCIADMPERGVKAGSLRPSHAGVLILMLLVGFQAGAWAADAGPAQTVRGEVVDADTNEPIPARIYLRDEQGNWHFVSSTSEEGSAVRYE